ncbi:MAG: putative ABC transporter antibiotic-transport ATP-binding protein [Ignavibacteriales bacterium]
MLTVENLHFTYPASADETLKGNSFSISQGEVFGFLGPSGSGKSTTQKILYRLLAGYSGDITFLQKPLNKWGREFYEYIGVSFELPNHYLKLTAEENLRFIASFYTHGNPDYDKLFALVDLQDDRHKPVSDYSKGMKMRLNFIRSLLHNPDMLFLDEPTSGLDPISAGRIKQHIRQLKDEGKTIFITTHNMFDADQLCDRVALLHRGRIVTIDKPSNLKIQHGQKKVEVTTEEHPANPYIYPLEGIGSNREFLELLRENKVRTIHSQEATLEEVFIKLTGDTLL